MTVQAIQKIKQIYPKKEINKPQTKKNRTECGFLIVADWTGLEPATPGVTGRYSNQLNYQSTELFSTCEYLVKNIRRILVGGTGVEPVTHAL